MYIILEGKDLIACRCTSPIQVLSYGSVLEILVWYNYKHNWFSFCG